MHRTSLEDVSSVLDSLERSRAHVDELDPRADRQFSRRPRYEYRPGSSRVHDSGSQVHGKASQVTVHQIDFPGMGAGSNLNAQLPCRDREIERATDRAPRSVERGDEPVSGHLYLTPAVMTEKGSDILMVACEDLLPCRVAKSLGRGRRANDVGEQDSRQYAIASLGRPRPSNHTLDIDRHDGLVAQYPGIVTWANVDDLTSHDVVRLAIPRDDSYPPGEYVHEVVKFAPLGPNDRLDVNRPAPAGIKYFPSDRHRPDRYEMHQTVV
jgi:hypothetical protein